jgi:hypothetical protein
MFEAALNRLDSRETTMQFQIGHTYLTVRIQRHDVQTTAERSLLT